MNRREMLRKGIGDLAQVLPFTLEAAGSLGRLLTLGAGLHRPRAASSFPTGNREGDGTPKVLKKEEV